MSLWNLSYAYDVPHYADFVVEAETEEQAEAIAKAALEAGRFSAVSGDACYDNLCNERVFTSGPATDSTNSTMEALIDKAGK